MHYPNKLVIGTSYLGPRPAALTIGRGEYAISIANKQIPRFTPDAFG